MFGQRWKNVFIHIFWNVCFYSDVKYTWCAQLGLINRARVHSRVVSFSRLKQKYMFVVFQTKCGQQLAVFNTIFICDFVIFFISHHCVCHWRQHGYDKIHRWKMGGRAGIVARGTPCGRHGKPTACIDANDGHGRRKDVFLSTTGGMSTTCKLS